MRAFILVKTREPQWIREYLSNHPSVKEVHLVYGGYDLVVVADVGTLEELGRLVIEEIRERFRVEETLTLISAD